MYFERKNKKKRNLYLVKLWSTNPIELIFIRDPPLSFEPTISYTKIIFFVTGLKICSKRKLLNNYRIQCILKVDRHNEWLLQEFQHKSFLLYFTFFLISNFSFHIFKSSNRYFKIKQNVMIIQNIEKCKMN